MISFYFINFNFLIYSNIFLIFSNSIVQQNNKIARVLTPTHKKSSPRVLPVVPCAPQLPKLPRTSTGYEALVNDHSDSLDISEDKQETDCLLDDVASSNNTFSSNACSRAESISSICSSLRSDSKIQKQTGPGSFAFGSDYNHDALSLRSTDGTKSSKIEETFDCPVCSYKANDCQSLQEHVDTIHDELLTNKPSNDVTQACPICQLVYEDTQKLTEHVESHFAENSAGKL